MLKGGSGGLCRGGLGDAESEGGVVDKPDRNVNGDRHSPALGLPETMEGKRACLVSTDSVLRHGVIVSRTDSSKKCKYILTLLKGFFCACAFVVVAGVSEFSITQSSC